MVSIIVDGTQRIGTVNTIQETYNKLSSVLDSTTTTLLASESYEGASFTSGGYAWIVGSLYADQDGTLKIQQSNDGTSWDVEDSISYTAEEKTGFSYEVVGNTARVVYVNGATDQTVFRLYVRARRV